MTIEVAKGDYHVTVWQDQVTVGGVWDHPIVVDTRPWFDPADGSLAVPDPDGEGTLVTVTCEEMRASALEKQYQPGLLTPPHQDLLFSPDGTSWYHQIVADQFGADAYVRQVATAGDTVVALVDPSGEAPTPDPPGCSLGVYPPPKPYEIWVTGGE